MTHSAIARSDLAAPPLRGITGGTAGAQRRSRSTTAIQALNLFNSPFVVERSQQFAKRVAAERPGTIEGQIERVFQLAVGHGPTAAQRDAAVRVAEEHGVETVCRVVLNSSEFLMVP